MQPLTRNPGGLRLIWITTLGVVLSLLFAFVAALPLRYVRIAYGRIRFLTMNAMAMVSLASLGLDEVALFHGAMVCLIAVYREFEERRSSIFTSALTSLVLASGLWFSGLYGLTRWQGKSLKTYLVDRMTPFKDQISEIPWVKEMDFQNVVWFLPSGITVLLMLVLFVSLQVQWDQSKSHSRVDIKMFRLPDWMIWTFIGSLGASYISLGNPMIAMVGKNLLIVSMAAYFFQGLAVLNHYLDRMHVNGFWRLLAWVLAFLQMQIFVCGLGILDFWFDFRLQGILNFKDQSQKRS